MAEKDRILWNLQYGAVAPVSPEAELRKAIECAAARAPQDYTTYYLLRSIAASLIKIGAY